MTDDRIAQIERELSEATPGPWSNTYSNAGNSHSTPNTVWAYKDLIANNVDHKDATLIANAPSHLRWLLDEVKRLRSDMAKGDEDYYEMRCLLEKECDALAARVKELEDGIAALRRYHGGDGTVTTTQVIKVLGCKEEG
jgi:hypothetical protein